MRKKLSIILPAFIFSLNILIGISFRDYGNFIYLIGSGWNVLRSMILVTFYTVIFSFVLKKLYVRAECIIFKSEDRLSSRFVTTSSFFILLFCYSWFLGVYYPGSINSDSLDQVAQFFGLNELTNHHPVLSSVLMGTCVKIGMLAGNGAIGMFLYTVLQTCVLAFAFAYTLGLMNKWGLPVRFIMMTLIFYGIMPFWGGYAQLMIKDTLYTAVVVLFVSQFLDILLESKRVPVSKKRMLLLALTGILTALLRNNGIYVVIPCLIGGLFLCRKRPGRLVWVMGLGICIVAYTLWGSVLLPMAGVKEGSIREMLSIPFQQTARYIGVYSEEVTDEEREAINAVLDYERIKSGYVPYGADPVKNTYKEPENELDALANYFKYWLLMFTKHPMVYFEATVANSYCYYCTNNISTVEPLYVNFIYTNEHSSYLGLTEAGNNEHGKMVFDRYNSRFQELPIIKWLFSEGFYTYLLIGMLGFLVYIGKTACISGLLPNMIGVLVCIASPILGSFRYFLPVIACTFISLAYCIKCKEE